jgi:hypothetical protein
VFSPPSLDPAAQPPDLPILRSGGSTPPRAKFRESGNPHFSYSAGDHSSSASTPRVHSARRVAPQNLHGVSEGISRSSASRERARQGEHRRAHNTAQPTSPQRVDTGFPLSPVLGLGSRSPPKDKYHKILINLRAKSRMEDGGDRGSRPQQIGSRLHRDTYQPHTKQSSLLNRDIARSPLRSLLKDRGDSQHIRLAMDSESESD